MREAFRLALDLVNVISVDAEAMRGVLRKKMSAEYRDCVFFLLVLMRLRRQKYDDLVTKMRYNGLGWDVCVELTSLL